MGPVLEKTYTTLKAGHTYVFTAKAKRYDAGGSQPELTLQAGALAERGKAVSFPEWRTLAYAFTAPTGTTKLQIICRHIYEPGLPGGANFALDDLHVRLPLYDLTDFEPDNSTQPPSDSQLNGWTPGEGSTGWILEQLSTGETVFRLPTYGSSGNDGVILRKTFAVVPGFQYTFRIKALASHPLNTAILALTADDTAISDQLHLTHDASQNNWQTLEGHWTAPNNGPEQVTFSVVSYRATGNGNDYYLSDLAVTETPDVVQGI